MKHTVPRSAETLVAISCDRCGQTWTAHAFSEAEFTSIDFIGGYDSVFGDGSQVELDLCQQCLRQTLGQWLRVSDPDHEETALARDLKAFDPAKHGGEAFAEAPVSLERLAADASAAADKSSLVIDDARTLFEEWQVHGIGAADTQRFVSYTLRHFPLHHAVARVDDCLGGLQVWLQTEDLTTNPK